MKSVYTGLYNDHQGKIAAQIETLSSLLDAHAQTERIKGTDCVTLMAVQDKLNELINLLGGVEALQ